MSSLDEWLDVQDKLETIAFDASVHSHLAFWKIFADDLYPQQCNILPLEIDLASSASSLVSPFDCYVGYAIRANDFLPTGKAPAALVAVFAALQDHIDHTSLGIAITKATIEGHQYCTYALLGKQAKQKLKLTALSYAYKLESILNSEKKLTILSSGCVLRSKKLQKGSTAPLCGNAPETMCDVTTYTELHIFAFYQKSKRKNPLLLYRSARDSAFLTVLSEEKESDKQSSKNSLAQTPGTGSSGKSYSLKPPMLKLTLKPYEQVTYEQISEEQNGQLKFDIRGTTRHELKMERFESECSQIIEGLYVSGEKVARNWQILQKFKIKAIVNCAGDYCENSFESREVAYLTFFLKDSQNENIECLFYRAIDFIQAAQKNKLNVLVHCIQGVSRSITIAIAFVIFKFGYDYKKAEAFVKQRRGIACPNNGFMVQLIQFYKRLYEEYNSLPAPRVFLVSSHCRQTPAILSARLIKQPLFDARKYIGLDSRAVYIVQASDVVYIWVGSKCEEKRLQNYWSYAQEYVKKLQKYERASLKIKAISQGSEGREFFSLWNLDATPDLYENPDYSRLFAEGESAKPGGLRKLYEREPEQTVQSRLFISPDYEKGLGVFEFEDLYGLCILVKHEDQRLRVFIWKDQDHEEQDEEFLDNILKTHYQEVDSVNITIVEQNGSSPSEAFMACFA